MPEEHRAVALEEIAHVDAAAASPDVAHGPSFRLERLPPMPTLVLCGERDRVNLKLSRRLAESLPDARFEIVPDAATWRTSTTREAFNRLLREFLAN